jgi:hypothetical protein
VHGVERDRANRRLGWVSKIGLNVTPPSDESHTPPPVAPTNIRPDVVGSAAIAVTRPVVATPNRLIGSGPIKPQVNGPVSSGVMLKSGAGPAGTFGADWFSRRSAPYLAIARSCGVIFQVNGAGLTDPADEPADDCQAASIPMATTVRISVTAVQARFRARSEAEIGICFNLALIFALRSVLQMSQSAPILSHMHAAWLRFRLRWLITMDYKL